MLKFMFKFKLLEFQKIETIFFLLLLHVYFYQLNLIFEETYFNKTTRTNTNNIF